MFLAMRYLPIALLLIASCAPTLRAQALEPADPSPNASAPTDHILFDGPVNAFSVGIFEADLDNHQKDDLIIVEINTPGGEVMAGFDMARAIERSKPPVACVVDGMAASMGLYILQSCDIRVMTTRSLLMGHQPATQGGGQPDDFEGGKEILTALNHSMAAHIVHKMKITRDEYEARIAHGHMWWMPSDEALSIGAIDLEVESVDLFIMAARLK